MVAALASAKIYFDLKRSPKDGVHTGMELVFCFDVLRPIACGSNALPDGQFHSLASLRKMSSLVERSVSEPRDRQACSARCVRRPCAGLTGRSGRCQFAQTWSRRVGIVLPPSQAGAALLDAAGVVPVGEEETPGIVADRVHCGRSRYRNGPGKVWGHSSLGVARAGADGDPLWPIRA